jgi:hypothetical protein
VSAVAGSPIHLMPGGRIVARTTDHDDLLHRLAAWLAAVSAEAASAPQECSTPLPRRPKVEPPR